MSSSERPILFLLPPDFLDPEEGEGPFVCPHCMAVEGLLSVYPILRRSLDIRYVPFKRPRTAIIELIGEAHQSCPVLVFPMGAVSPVAAQESVAGRLIFKGEHAIAEALAEAYGTGRMH